MIKTFFDRDDEDAHDDFQRGSAATGATASSSTSESPDHVMLHLSPCPHLGDTDWTRAEYRFHSLTRTKKICSTDRRELEMLGERTRHGDLEAVPRLRTPGRRKADRECSFAC